MLLRSILTATVITAILGCSSRARPQSAPPAPPSHGELDAPGRAPDSAELQQQRFLENLKQAVVRLQAAGERTMDAIENSEVTLEIETMEDNSRLSVACNSGGSVLTKLIQSLAGELQLKGKVQHAVCTGSGRDDDPFQVKFNLHYESGRTALFSENAPSLQFTVEKPEDETSQSSREGRSPSAESEEEPPPQPVMLSPHQSQSSHTVVKLPQGWTPVKLPAPVHADSAFGTLDSKETFADGVLTIERKLRLKRDRVEVTELPAFGKWLENVEGSVSIALRSTVYYPEIDASAGTEVQQKAANLIYQAYQDIQHREFAKAEAALNNAEALDPTREVLHENRGELAAARGNYVTALAEYRKELEAFPQALLEMESIARAQRQMGDSDGETATLQRWMQADPNSPFAAVRLMDKFHKLGNDDAAVRVGDEAMNIMTQDAKCHLGFLELYGQEQMLTGNAAGAKSTLEAVLDLTMDGNSVNNAAYILAEQGSSLERAEEVTREALKAFEAGDDPEGVSGVYGETPAARASLLFATWDTLGWILYRKGETSAAEGYIRAAWRNRQDIAVARHLGELLTAQEKPAEAMDVYTLGLSSISGANASQAAKDPDTIAVRASMARLKEKGVVSSVSDPKAALLAMRTFNVGSSVKPQAETQCSVHMGASGNVVLLHKAHYDLEAIPVDDPRIFAALFPPGSEARVEREGKLQCSKSCLLVLAP